MLSSVARFSVLPIALAWLVLLAGPVKADNFLAHGYERVFFWGAYETFCGIEGPDKQQHLLAFKQQKGQESRNNRGSGPGGMLTYPEFIARVDDKPLPPDIPVLSHPDPPGKVSFAVDDLLKKKLTGEVIVYALDPSLRGKSFNKPPGGKQKKPGSGGGSRNLYDPKDPHRTSFTVLVDGIVNALQQHLMNPRNKAVFQQYLPFMKEALQATITLRRETTNIYLLKKLTSSPADGGFDLNAQFDWRDSKIPLGSRYPEFRIKETYDQNTGKLRRLGFKDADDFGDYIKRFGDPSYKGKVEFGPGAFTHHRLLLSWEEADRKLHF
ncbi:hypothetical protein TESG_03290 [Trichophyton tonsurans CBS 112818]|uniref:Uncharacterized protein n=2 Tax=Trichophyton TaxID=5550 RepID=F2Q0R6_TRIEC|nr:hypothetical protein TESG_03290 [Trichophyton tonsurans CBS 112818]EGE07734.1 hypothetical protein TEQG_06717 [Trichophyton equinum CBS 127.97]